jgi:tetratricopeptide (TPR) repeat protein
MAEEVLNLLARIPDLRVISRSSAFTYKGKDLKLSEIARELSVAHILEGSVRRSGNRIRITAQLIEARSDTHLWSATWDREFADIFAIQDEIAAEVVANLKLKLLGEVPRARRVDPEAYALYLQGRFLIEWNDFESLAPALEFMRSALEIDPDYARAWAGIAWVYYRYWSQQRVAPVPGAPMTKDEAARLYQEATAQALAIDPDDPAALSLKAWQFLRVTPDYAKAAYYFERALAAGPGDGSVLASAASLAGQLGQKELSLKLMQASVDRDPMCTWCQWILLVAYSDLGRFDEADALMGQLKARGVNVPHSAEFPYWLAKGDFEQARRILAQLDPSRPDVPAMEAVILIEEGRTGEARAIIEALEKESAGAIANDIAHLYARLGEYARALEWYEKGVAANGCRQIQLNFSLIQQWLQTHRNDPRWLELTRRCGVSLEELAQINFAPEIPE